MLNKDDEYIQNWNEMFSWGQDTFSGNASYRARRGYRSARYWDYLTATDQYVDVGFRPVLEVLNPGTLGSDCLLYTSWRQVSWYAGSRGRGIS